MATPPIPEILPPDYVPPPRPRIDDETLENLARLLDDAFPVPGTSLRFGIDPLLGLIPGLGDLISALFGFIIIFAAWDRGLPRVTIARMVANIVIDSGLGTLPLLGDAFDVLWKSNRRNYELLIRSSADRDRRHTWRDWAFLGALAAAVLATVALPLLLLWWLVRWLWP